MGVKAVSLSDDDDLQKQMLEEWQRQQVQLEQERTRAIQEQIKDKAAPVAASGPASTSQGGVDTPSTPKEEIKKVSASSYALGASGNKVLDEQTRFQAVIGGRRADRDRPDGKASPQGIHRGAHHKGHHHKHPSVDPSSDAAAPPASTPDVTAAPESANKNPNIVS